MNEKDIAIIEDKAHDYLATVGIVRETNDDELYYEIKGRTIDSLVEFIVHEVYEKYPN